MAPPKWTTAEQEAWLQPWYEKYLGKQSEKCRNYSNFFADLNEHWFDAFPEPRPNNCTTVGPLTKEEMDSAVDARKDKLYIRFKNNCGGSKAGRQAKAKATDAFNAVVRRITECEKPTRTLQEHEAYSKLYYADRIQKSVQETLKKAEEEQPLTNGQHIALLKKETAALYADESEDVKSQVKEYIAAQKNQRMDRPETWSIEDQERNLTKLAAIVNQFIRGLADATGLAFSLLVGGPSAELGGLIDVWSFHVGHTKLGNDFSQAYPDFDSGIIAPFRDYLYRVYPDAAMLKPGEMGMSKNSTASVDWTITPSSTEVPLPSSSSSLTPSSLTFDNQFDLNSVEHAELDWLSDDYLDKLHQMSMQMLPGAPATGPADPPPHTPIPLGPTATAAPIISRPTPSNSLASPPVAFPPIFSDPPPHTPLPLGPTATVAPTISHPTPSNLLVPLPATLSPILSPPIVPLSKMIGPAALSTVLSAAASLPAVSPYMIDTHLPQPQPLPRRTASVSAEALPAASPSMVDTHLPQPQPLPHRTASISAEALPAASPSMVDAHLSQPQPLPRRTASTSAEANNDVAEGGRRRSARAPMPSTRNTVANSIGGTDSLPHASISKRVREVQSSTKAGRRPK
ncbi:uncharacterized protein EDB93DRAFT_1251522 [Suillus bovinus]|uniref:uncharacterized protein n=1 Tax=Suillus bovinus TaxID=48563 RepID=UPI001B85E3AD|nr:uncharacterized protein EDB93DRAFT_1251522 [Suillus bovinus]KAG2144654.1 hypothetical protein EDB93DRAFT_1251522 [Suillus bovinus]